jgi:hypothetical protein
MGKIIEKAYTFFMMPFYIKEGQEIVPGVKSVWKQTKMNIDKGILYSHIQEFLSKSVIEDKQIGSLPTGRQLASHDYQIYSLSSESNRFTGMMSSDTEHAILIKETVAGKKDLKQITFRFKNTEKDLPLFFSPKLVVCPNAQVGMLLFSIEMTDRKDMESLSKMNYALFKTYKEDSSQTVPVYLSRQAKMRKIEDELDVMRKEISKAIKAVRKLRERLKVTKNDKTKANDENLIACNCDSIKRNYSTYKAANEQFLNSRKEEMQNDKRFTQWVNDIDSALERTVPSQWYNIRELLDHHWTMRQLLESLMADFKGKYVRADDFRLHVFTYIQVGRIDKNTDDYLYDFSRIIRCQDQDYLALPTSSGHNVYEPLFKNVYIGSTVEGGGVMTIQQGPGDDFMKSFANGPLTHSYLWVYLLAIMQRHTLLQMSRELADEYGYSGKDLDSRLVHLRLLMRKMSKTKINTYFTDVSDHSHLNALYEICCRNFSVDRYFADVDSKLATLKETLEQLHDEQMEAYKKTEKDMDKIQNKILKWVAVLALTLTLFSGLNDSYDYFSNYWDAASAPGTHGLIVIAIIVAAGMIAWRIVEGIQNKNINKKQ